MCLLERLEPARLPRPLVGFVAAVSSLVTATALAGPDDHKFHEDHADLIVREGPPLEAVEITVATRHGSVDIAPHGTPLPEWARGLAPERIDDKTHTLVITRVFADREGLIEMGEPVHEPRRRGEMFTTEWDESLASGDHGTFGTHYVIRVPALGAVDAKTGLGPIRIVLASGAVKAKTGLGPIGVDHAQGDVDAKTGQGPVQVSFAEGHAGHATMKSGLGSLAAVGAKWADAKTGQGSINITLAEQPLADMKLQTALGSISLRMPDGTDAIVSASTAMGQISIDGFNANGSGNAGRYRKMTTVLGDGGIEISCTTNQGSITIDG